jgi:hypothetical protein
MTTTPDTESPRFQAAGLLRVGTQQLVHSFLKTAHGKGALAHRAISPKHAVRVSSPTDWCQAVDAARQVAHAASDLIAQYASKARAQGISWATLAGAVGVHVDEDQDPARAAFVTVTAGRPAAAGPAFVVWLCPGCEHQVNDYGPYHPGNEVGHDDHCPRHLTDLAAYRAATRC